MLDGDTFETNTGMRVRLAGADAPEFDDTLSDAATAELRRLIDGKEVAIDMVGLVTGRVIANVSVQGKSVDKAMYDFVQKRQRPRSDERKKVF